MKWIFVLLIGILAASNLVQSKTIKDIDKEVNYDDVLNDDYDYGDDDDQTDDGLSVKPTIKSKPVNKTVHMGETVYLPCDAVDADSYVTMWKKGNELLYQERITVGNHESRYHRYQNRTLQIVNVNGNDTAKYSCSVLVADTDEVKVVHTLTVLTPPKVLQIYTGDGKNEIIIGDVLVLICKISGTPEPKVIWSKEGTRVGEGTSITIDNFRKDNAGMYQCMADNELGEPATAALLITAIHPPVITLEKMTVNSNLNYESQLTCIVHALPKATVLWKKGNEIIAPSDHVTITHEGNHHTLTIKQTKQTDFGNYSCHAENKIGQGEKHIVLSGKPASAKFVHKEFQGDDVILIWEIESNSAITEHHLEYRMKETKKWKSESPMVVNPQGNVYTVKHVLTKVPMGVYEVKLRSKNEYGWSPFSRHIIFEKNFNIDDMPRPALETLEDINIDDMSPPAIETLEVVGGTGSGSQMFPSTLLIVILFTLSRRFV